MLNVIHSQMRALVSWYGCYDAAAATISARLGRSVSKGTLARKMNGNLEWTVSDIVALEDASGTHPITQTLLRRLGESGPAETTCLNELGGQIAKEAGEAVQATLAANDTQKVARAIREIDEAI